MLVIEQRPDQPCDGLNIHMSSSSEAQFRLAEIEVSKASSDEHIVGVFRYESDFRGKRGPLLVLVVDIASTLYVYEQLLDTINSCAEQTRLLVAGVDTDPMARFEKLVQRLNESVAEFLKREPTSIAWSRVNIFILELSEQQICLTGLGRLSNIFLQKQPDESYKAFDLFSSLEQPETVQPDKPFAALICGDMQPGDILFAGSRNFDRLRDELELIQRLKTLPPVTAAHEIRQELEHGEIPDDYAGVIVASVSLPATVAAAVPSRAETSKPKSTASIEKLYEAEQEAEAMLSPTIAPTAAAKSGVWKERLREGRQRLLTAFRKPRFPKDPLTVTSLRGMHAGHSSSLTPKRKIILAAYVLVPLLVIVGIFWFRAAKRASAQQALWDTVYDQVTDRKNRAESDLVYGNEERATRFLNEARTLSAGLDESTGKRKDRKAVLTTELTELARRLQHVTPQDNPPVMLALEPAAPADSLQTLALFNHKLFAVDQANSVWLQADLQSATVNRLPLPRDSQPLAATGGKDLLLLLANKQTAFLLGTTGTTPKTVAWGNTKAVGVKAAVIYNKRLYTLDPTGNMLWKYSLSDTGPTKEQAYLKQNTHPLTDAVALTIDSNVYVGWKNGQVIRYLSGAEEDWSLHQVEPPLTSLSGLWTDPDSDRLVVTDPANKRILVFQKNGQLVSQIVSHALQAPQEVVGDPSQKKLYVRDGNKILSFDLP